MVDVLRASASGRWVNCPFSPVLEARHPQETSEHALFGTDTHEMAELVLTGRYYSTHDVVGNMSSGDRVFTDEMVPIADMYIDYVKNLGMNFWVERDVSIRGTKIAGRCDTAAYNYDTDEQHLHVIDLKCGYSIVEAFQNTQQIIYAEGTIRNTGITPTHITITIVQPRAKHPDGPVRKWTITRDELSQWMAWIIERSNVAGQPECNTGPHCDHCDGITYCPAAITAGFNAVDVSKSYVDIDLSPEDLARMIDIFDRAGKQMKHLLSGLQARVEASISNNQPVPGWTVKPGTGQRKFSDPDKAIETGKYLGVNMVKESIITPAEAERQGFPKAIINTMTVVPTTAPKLVRTDAQKISEMFK